MNYHLISDDSFILPGIIHVMDSINISAFVYNIGNRQVKSNKAFLPQPGDVVCIIVNNVHLRSRLLRNPVLARCRLIVMLDIPVTPSRQTHFPWLLPKNISIKAFSEVIQKTQRSCVFREKVSFSTLTLFEELCNGKTVASISAYSQAPMKTVYKIKRNIFHKYGLLNCNSAGILLCRDILSMKIPV